ncbi:MAG: two-component regulator propeller domain-containing protein [Acidobacteriota bacterium]
MQQFLLLLFSTLVAGVVPAALASAMEPSYTATTWRVEEGLPEDTVQAFAETPQGYLWIGTSGGLARFDGTHFAVFDSDTTPLFRENSVHCLATARDGSLWIGMEGSGLIHFSHGKFHAWTAVDGLTDQFVHAIAEDRAGNLWIGTNNGFFRMTKGRIRRLDGTHGIPLLAVNAILEDASGRVWIGGSRLMSIHNNVFQEHSLPGELSRNRIKSLLQTRDGAIWVGTVSGLYRSPDGTRPFERVPGANGTVRVLRQSGDGTLWISIVGQGAAAWRLDRGAFAPNPVLRIPGTILSIFEDRERNIWVGSQSGMTRYSATPVSIVPVPDARNSDFATIYLDRDGVLWSAGNHLVRIAGNRAVPFVFPELRGAKVRNLLRDRDGTLWVGTDGSGLFHLSVGSARRYTTAEGLVNNFIRVLVQDANGSLWIGTDEGVSHLENGHFTNYGIVDGLAYFSIRAMLQDRYDSMWIGTDQGLSHWVHGHFVVDGPVVALRQQKVWALHQDSSGGLWFGTRNHGLYRWRGGRLTRYTTADGLAGNGINSILEDGAEHFWMSGPEGVSLLNRRELDAFADLPRGHRPHPLAISFYSLPGDNGPTQIFGGVQSAGCITPAGDVWFPGNRGPVHVSPPPSRPTLMPPLIIDHVSADHLAAAWTPGESEVILGPANSRLDIAYGPLMLSSQQNVRFRYRLVNFDREWLDALGRRDSSYANLPAGRYVFRVAAFQTSNPNAVAEASLVVIKNPYFYRRWWFLLCIAFGLIAAVLAIYRARLNRMRQRFIGVLEERNRIAREIHDTVIQGCTSISAALEAVSTLRSGETRLKENLLERARTQARITIDEAREAVWNLRQDTGGMLDDSLRATSSQIAAEFGIPVHCTIRGKSSRMSQPAMHEVLMIVREALHNAALHGTPAAIEVTAISNLREMMIEIADNGRGFDMDNAWSSDHGHYGLLGMQERASRLRGSIEFVSGPGQGTRVVLRVPSRGTAIHATLAGKAGTL